MGDLWQWLNSAENDFEAARKTSRNLDVVPLKPILSVGILAGKSHIFASQLCNELEKLCSKLDVSKIRTMNKHRRVKVKICISNFFSIVCQEKGLKNKSKTENKPIHTKYCKRYLLRRFDLNHCQSYDYLKKITE